MDWILSQQHIRVIILLMPVFVHHLGFSTSLLQGLFYSTLPSGILLAFLRLMVHLTNKDYVNSRKDMQHVTCSILKRIMESDF